MTTQLDEVMAALSPEIRRGLQKASEVTIEKQPVPSFGLNRALQGGLPYGRQVLIWGNKSAGKSTFCLQTAALAQADGKVCAWIDSEKSFDPEWARKVGVKTDELIYTNAQSMDMLVDIGTDLMDAGADVIVVDSISALMSGNFFEKDGVTLSDFGDTNGMGNDARDLAKVVKMLNYANGRNKPVLLILISQLRNKLGSMFVSQNPTGGFAVQFYSSTVVKLWSSETDSNAIKEKIPVGDKLIEQAVGRNVTWTVNFNKTGPAFVSGNYDFYFKGDNIGIDRLGEIVDIAIEQGVIAKGGTGWFTIDGEKMQGRPKVIEYFRSNPDKAEDIANRIQ